MKLKTYQYVGRSENNDNEIYNIAIEYFYQDTKLIKKTWEKNGEVYKIQVNQYKGGQLLTTSFYKDEKKQPYKVLSGFNKDGKNPEKEVEYSDGEISETVVNKYNHRGLLISKRGGFLDEVISYKGSKRHEVRYVGHSVGRIKYGDNGLDYKQFWIFDGKSKVERVGEVSFRGNTSIMDLDNYKVSDIN